MEFAGEKCCVKSLDATDRPIESSRVNLGAFAFVRTCSPRSEHDQHYLGHRKRSYAPDTMVPVIRIPWKIQLALVACAYAGVLAISAFLIVWRYWQYVNHPADVAASGGMWAGGDLMLEFFICGMLLAVTFVLVLVIYQHETAYANYSKIMLVLSATAPAAVLLMAIPAIGQSNSLLGWACMFRVFASPLVLAGFAMNRLFARFPRAKRMTRYALLIEGVTLVFMFLMLFLPVHLHRA